VIDENSTLEDVCFEVSAAMDRHGITSVLTGGSAATVYAPQFYTSLDADFVLINFPARAQLDKALVEVGYVPSETGGMYENPRSMFTIDFPKGPLSVAGDYVSETAIIERGDIKLRILTVTDCVRDRLSSFYFWNDYTGLNAAIGVAKARRDQVDFARLRAWTERESGPASADYLIKYDEFLRRLSNHMRMPG
jgi:hypothetical protein